MATGERLPYSGGSAGSCHAAERRSHRVIGLGSRGVHSLNSAFLISDHNLVAGLDAFHAADVDYVSAFGCVDCEA